MHLVLASASPRRKKLLDQLGLKFIQFPVNISESLNNNLSEEAQVLDIAERKSQAAGHSLYQDPLGPTLDREYGGALLLTADTLVLLKGQFLGKPDNQLHAQQMLKSLSGQMHEVITAVCMTEIFANKRLHSWTHIDRVQVYFRELNEAEINQYIQSGEPMDKAGSYGFQGAGREFVKSVTGDFETVIGLSTRVVQMGLLQNNWIQRIK
jgi:septum formation protein